jgi:hypothetical protein
VVGISPGRRAQGTWHRARNMGDGYIWKFENGHSCPAEPQDMRPSDLWTFRPSDLQKSRSDRPHDCTTVPTLRSGSPLRYDKTARPLDLQTFRRREATDRRTARLSEATDRTTARPSRRYGRDLRFTTTRPQDLWTFRPSDVAKRQTLRLSCCDASVISMKGTGRANEQTK